VSREFCHKILGLFRGLFQAEGRNFGIEAGRERFQALAEARQAFLRLLRAHRFLPPPIAHICLRLKVCLPGVVRVPMQVIVVQGKLTEMLQDDFDRL